MPIYEYECKVCHQRQEAIQKMSDDPLVECGACGKPELRKLISAPAFVLKGEGFYGSGSNPRVKEGPKISSDISSLSDVELNRSLGLPDDHNQPLTVA